ncbi:sigma-70 family RNA polymerase sigma factor [Halalkalibacter flavus]|uniref:sigma-70 family RNA polymerase sigma factor n=1 Tax=Halalkalibacter flavus TaxID=3090668 RepID=UPI002FC6580B
MDQLKEVKKATKGNVSSFEKLIVTYKVMMYRVAKTILSHDEDCADAIQEAILKAYKNVHTLREPAYFKTWLVRIVMNECHQLNRNRKNLVSIEELAEPYSKDHGFEKIDLEQMLDSLPKEQKQLLKLYHLDDISIHELSLIFEVSENTIKTRLRRAREKMREKLTKHEEVSTWINGKNN